ncbi:helix-turn-helix transcriptional regulator [Larkinella soli]|uniref:helix-turn-helix transcriptional regulator n=1 Tax=Larkinella soli TaxID=1770527 RepID=UPI000FFBBD54|nr:LuxR C-terminal-related transcriptional regulator [Larkinella soli]
MVNLLSNWTYSTPAASSQSSQELSVLDQFFPGWVLAIFENQGGDTPRFLSRNASEFWGMTDEELTRKTCHDIEAMIHPDDLDGYLRCRRRMAELQKTLKPSEALHYRFAIQYRLRPHRHLAYRHVYGEVLTYLDGQNRTAQAMMYRDASADRVSDRVQLTWYRTHGLDYHKVGSYIPATAEQGLTVREEEILHLIKEGFSSKEMADRLSISLNTVKNHRKNLLRKTQSRNMADLVHTVTAGLS